MLCTNTHDTKRSADVRARLDVLSEVPDLWRRTVTRWRRLNRRHRTVVAGRLTPDANTEYLLYQTLVGLWPAPVPGRRVDDLPSTEWLEATKERVEQYMMKAVKEAKTFTSWTDPDPAFEEAVRQFIRVVLTPRDESTFLSDVSRFVARIAPAGALNTLARLCLHYTSPGIPDTYQGDELWFRALVDPDNRRPVDFRARQMLLQTIPGLPDVATAADIASEGASDRLKLHLVRSLLHARRANPELFREGSYEPIPTGGVRSGHVFAFLRRHGEQAVLVLVPRLIAGCFGKRGEPRSAAWEEITLGLPAELAGRQWRSVITGQPLPADPSVEALFTPVPVAVLITGNR